MLKLLGRSALAIACGVVALSIDVLINMVASGAWSWQASVGVVVAAAAVGAAVDALRQSFKSHQQLPAAKLDPWPGDDLLVERPDEKQQIVKALRSNRRRANVVILEGAGGYGKSTLARSVCTDQRVAKKYSAVYRVGCAEDAVTDLAIAGLVNGLLENITGHRPGHYDPETAGQHLSRVLGRRGKVLLLVDDVWTNRQVQPFLVGAKRCTRLVATRMSALPLASATRVHVGPMSAPQSRDLLMRGLSPGVADLSDAALLDRVISRTWHWPLILSLLNKVLLERVHAGYSPDAVLEEILHHLAVGGPVYADKLDVEPGPLARSDLVETTLSAGLALVKAQDARERLLDLAVFPPRAAVPMKLITELWASRSSRPEAEAASLCSRMAELSFFRITDGHLQLHDVMYEFLRSQLDEAARAELAGLLLNLLSQDLTAGAPTGQGEDNTRTAWWEEGPFAAYVRDNVVLHMMEAGRQQEADALVCDLHWTVRRLQASGTTSVLDDLGRVPTGRALRLSGAVKRVAHMLGEATVRPDAVQFLLNALREEPEWAEQAVALQRERSEPMLVSHWPLPDNPGSALRHVYKIPSSTRRNDAVALSPDGSWLAMAGDSGLFKVDTATALVTAAYRSDVPIDRIAIGSNGLIAILSIAGTITVHDAATGAVIAQGHDDGALWSIAFAPDGESLVTTGNDGRVKLWDARTCERLRGDDFYAFPRHSLDDRLPIDLGSSVAVISGNGERVVSGGAQQVLLWSMPDGRALEAFSAAPYGGLGLIEHVAAAPDCSWVAGSNGRMIYVWSTKTGELTTTLEARGNVMALAVTRDGSHLASGDTEGALFVWESQRFTLRARLHGHGGVRSLGFSPDGQLLYSGGSGDAREWELPKATSLSSSEEGTPVERVVVSPAGTWVAVAVQGGDVHIRNAATGQVEATLTGHRTRVRNIAVAPDGGWLATELGGTIFVWDTTGWTLTSRFDVQSVTGEIIDIFVSADSSRLFTVDYIAVRVWDPGSGKLLISMASCLEGPEALSFSHDQSWLAGGDYYGTIWIWHAKSGNLQSTLGGGYLHARVAALTATPDNTLLACPVQGPIRTWDIQQAKIVSTSAFHRGGLAPEVAISPDGASVLVCEAGTVKRYNLASSEVNVVKPDRDHFDSGRPTALAVSGDGQWFAIGGPSGTEVKECSSHRDGAEWVNRPNGPLYGRSPQAIALTFNGDRLASATEDHVVIWDLSTSQVAHEFRLRNSGGYIYYIKALAFSHDGRRLAIAAGDRITIRHIASGGEQEVSGNFGAVHTAALSPEGRYVAIVGSEGVRMWDARSGRAVAVLRNGRGVNHLLFGPHDEWLAIAGDRAVEIFSLPQAERLTGFALVSPDEHQDHIREMTATPDGTRIIVRTASGGLIMLDSEKNDASALVDVGWDAVDIMLVSPNGKWLATGGQDLSVRRMLDGSQVATHGMNRRVKSLAWAPDSNSIVAGGDGGIYFLLFENQPE